MPEGNPHYLPAPPEFTSGGATVAASHKRLTIEGTKVLLRATQLVGIEPVNIPAPGVLQVIAQRPDGAIEPLIWIEKFSPDYNQTYYFRNTLRLPAGTQIEITPRAGSATLLLK
jgi:hypothetical protein